MEALQKIAGKNHCASPQRERQSRLISLDCNYTKQYNCNNDFDGNHCSSFRGINFHHRASTCGEYPNAIVSKSPKSLFIPRDFKHKSDSPTFKLKQEQNQILQSSFSTLSPNTEIFL